MSFRILSLVIAATLLATACEAPIPGRDAIEADAAWTAGEWTADDGTVWLVRINGRRINATAEAGPGEGRIMRGSVQQGVLHYTLQANDGTDLFKTGEARIGDATHAIFHDDPTAGDAGPHGVWHFNHTPSVVGVAAPVIPTTPSPTPSTLPSATPSPTAEPTLEPTPEATPTASPTPSSTPTSPAAPGVIDLLPPR